MNFINLCIKSKNACKNINKTIFLEFWYLKKCYVFFMSCIFYYYYLCKCDFYLRDLTIYNLK